MIRELNRGTREGIRKELVTIYVAGLIHSSLKIEIRKIF